MDKVITVHGTNAGKPEDTDPEGDNDWWQKGSDFTNELLSQLGALPNTPEIIPFHWGSGPNSEQKRRSAGRKLLQLMRNLENEQTTYSVIAHSHGGSVLQHALNHSRFGKPLIYFKSAVCVGTPFIKFRTDWIARGFTRFVQVFMTLIAVVLVALIFDAASNAGGFREFRNMLTETWRDSVLLFSGAEQGNTAFEYAPIDEEDSWRELWRSFELNPIITSAAMTITFTLFYHLLRVVFSLLASPIVIIELAYGSIRRRLSGNRKEYTVINIFHPQDEAINLLKNAGKAKFNLFNAEFMAPFLWPVFWILTASIFVISSIIGVRTVVMAIGLWDTVDRRNYRHSFRCSVFRPAGFFCHQASSPFDHARTEQYTAANVPADLLAGLLPFEHIDQPAGSCTCLWSGCSK